MLPLRALNVSLNSSLAREKFMFGVSRFNLALCSNSLELREEHWVSPTLYNKPYRESGKSSRDEGFRAK